MAETVDISKIRIYQDEGMNRRAYIRDFKEPFYYGVHGGVKDFYKTEPETEHPSTLDHIVSAAAGWMTGTLSGALEARKIPTFPDKLRAEAEGTIEAPERVMKITHIQLHFQLDIPKGKRPEAERALKVFERGCPVAQTLKGCVQIDYDWEINEEES